MQWLRNTRLIIAGVIVALIIIMILQNMEEVTVRLLFVEAKMPRAALLLVAWAAGALTVLLLRRRSPKAKPEPEKVSPD